MARGQAEQADKQRALTNSVAAGQGAQGPANFRDGTSGHSGSAQEPGFDPITAAAIRRSGMDATNTASTLQIQRAQRAGSTGNDAMYYASANDLAQKRAAGLSTASTGC